MKNGSSTPAVRTVSEDFSRLGLTVILIAAVIIAAIGGDAKVHAQVGQRQDSPGAAKAILPLRGPARTVEELQGMLREVTSRPGLARAQVALKVASLDSGRVLYELDAAKLFIPASNMKLFTIAAALDRLTPEFQFTTSVYAAARPDSAGVIKGDLTVVGHGDPTIAASLNNGDYWKGINELADKLAAAGVKRVQGDLVGDESYFTGPEYGFGWEWDDIGGVDGAEVSALAINDDGLDVLVKPARSVGAQPIVTTGPPMPYVSIVNQAVTGAAGTLRELTVERIPGESVIRLTGVIPVDDKGYAASVSLPHPALAFVYMLRAALAQRGVIVTGKNRTVDAHLFRSNSPLLPESGTAAKPPVAGKAIDRLQAIAPFKPEKVELAKLQSPALAQIVARTLKLSQNLYSELLLRTLGKHFGTDPRLSSADNGTEVVKQFLLEAGLSQDSFVLADGSGLSRHNLVSAEATLQLLSYMQKHKFGAVFRDALPIAGLEGTLRNRLKATPAANNLRAKTGTLSQVATLSGYVTSAAGEHLVFSAIVNNLPQDSLTRRQYLDDIAVILASFAGRS